MAAAGAVRVRGQRLGYQRADPGGVGGAGAAGHGLRYERAEGTDPVGVFDAAEELAEHAREHGRPAVLHMRTVRYGGHAGTDVESAYRDAAGIRADRDADPLVATARVLVATGLATPGELVQRTVASRAAVRAQATELMACRRLASAAEVVAPLSPRHPAAVHDEAASLLVRDDDGARSTLAESINRALGDLLEADDRVLVFGEDVGVKGGVYGVTRGLQRAAGEAHVFDTLLDEQTILGLALGTAVSGYVPIPEIQYLAYVHNAIDQLRGEAATLSFFSQHQYRNGMVVRIAGYGYQKGFGGHFHNDNGLGGLRDVPGVVVASPATGADAASMLRTCAAAAAVDGTVSVFLEPIALYHTRDLHEPGDEGWLTAASSEHIPIGSGRVARDGDDVLVVSWANGLYLSLRAAERLRREGIECRVFDTRWLVPLPIDDLVAHARAIGRVVVVDETRHTGGAGEAIVTALVEHGVTGTIRRVAGCDSFIPLGDAANLVLVSEDEIADAIRAARRGLEVSAGGPMRRMDRVSCGSAISHDSFASSHLRSRISRVSRMPRLRSGHARSRSRADPSRRALRHPLQELLHQACGRSPVNHRAGRPVLQDRRLQRVEGGGDASPADGADDADRLGEHAEA